VYAAHKNTKHGWEEPFEGFPIYFIGEFPRGTVRQRGRQHSTASYTGVTIGNEKWEEIDR